MPSYVGRPGNARKSSPSFHSTNHHHTHRHGDVMRSQSLRNRAKRRPKLRTLSTAMVSLYVEPDLNVTFPKTALESSGEYEYTVRSVKKHSSIRRSHSFHKNKSKSPVPSPSRSSVLDTMHMYTIADEIARRESSPFSLLSKHYLERLDLGSVSFDTCLSIEPTKKENTTFRTPVGIRLRPVSTLMRYDGTAASRASTLRLKQEMDTAASTKRPESPLDGNGPLFSEGGVVLRRRLGVLGPGAHQRPVSASFVEPPTVKKVQATTRMSLRWSHGGSLTDLTQPHSTSPSQSPPTQSPTSKIRPCRPAPQAPARPPSRTGTPDSGRSTPKGYRTQSPLVRRQSNNSSSSPRSSSETISGSAVMIPNGRITPNSHTSKNNRVVPYQDHCTVSPVLGMRCNTSSPQLPMIPIREEGLDGQTVVSPLQFPGMQRNTSSPTLPMIAIEEEEMTPFTAPQAVVPPPRLINGRVPPPPMIRRDSLYVSPRKQSRQQSLTLDVVDVKRLRASQILQTGGITGGDLSSSRMDLLEAIRKGIQLQKVQKKEREEESLVSLPWDVAAILERRLALELDTESSDSESNNTDWEDDD